MTRTRKPKVGSKPRRSLFARIQAGLEDVLSFARGDPSAARVYEVHDGRIVDITDRFLAERGPVPPDIEPQPAPEGARTPAFEI